MSAIAVTIAHLEQSEGVRGFSVTSRQCCLAPVALEWTAVDPMSCRLGLFTQGLCTVIGKTVWIGIMLERDNLASLSFCTSGQCMVMPRLMSRYGFVSVSVHSLVEQLNYNTWIDVKVVTLVYSLHSHARRYSNSDHWINWSCWVTLIVTINRCTAPRTSNGNFVVYL
jgi:hypothetical protein